MWDFGILERGKRERRKKTHTSCTPRANGAVRRIGGIATDITHARVVQALVLVARAAKVLAVEVLHAPEAACRDGRLLGAFRDRDGDCWDGHGRSRLCEWAEEAREEGGHATAVKEGGREESDEEGEDEDDEMTTGWECRRFCIFWNRKGALAKLPPLVCPYVCT